LDEYEDEEEGLGKAASFHILLLRGLVEGFPQMMLQ
jgi:hypothetical protein